MKNTYHFHTVEAALFFSGRLLNKPRVMGCLLRDMADDEVHQTLPYAPDVKYAVDVYYNPWRPL